MGDASFAGLNFNDPESKQIFDYRDKNMCADWNNAKKELHLCDVNIMKNQDDTFMIDGRLKGDLLSLSSSENLVLKYWAANTPTYSSNFSGSGLPFATQEMAFENTNNFGKVNIKSGYFSFTLRYPNSYYKNMGTEYVFPEVMIKVFNSKDIAVSNTQHINLGEGIPFRSLTWSWERDWNDGPLFYKNENLPVRTQHQILLDSAYPKTNTMPKNFWGLRPPN